MSNAVRAGLLALKRAKPAYDEGEAYYLGKAGEVFISDRVRRLLGTRGNRFRVNFARTPVDVLLERTEIAGITSDDAVVESFINGVWSDNQMGLEAKDVHRMAYEFGDSYLIAQPDEDEPNGISAYCHDPRTVRVFYDPSRPRKKSHAIQHWYERGDEENGLSSSGVWLRINVYYGDRTEMWASTTPALEANGGYTLDLDTVEFHMIDEVENPTGIVPVFHFRNGRPYGRPEHADAMPIQDMINKTLITMMSSLEGAGFPQRYVLENESEAATNAFEAAINPSDAPTTGDVPAHEAGPASVFFLNAKSTGQYAVAESSNFLGPVHSLIQQMAAVTDVPMHYFDLTGGMPSGESYRAANGPLDKKVGHNQSQFGVTWREFFEYCLAVNGSVGMAQVSWKPAETFTDKDSWEAAKLQLEAGVPFEQVAAERGYSPKLIEEWRATRDAIRENAAAAALAADKEELGNIA